MLKTPGDTGTSHRHVCRASHKISQDQLDSKKCGRNLCHLTQKDLRKQATAANLQPLAGVVELADTPDLGSGAARFGGSSPPSRILFLEFSDAQVLEGQVWCEAFAVEPYFRGSPADYLSKVCVCPPARSPSGNHLDPI